MRSASSRQESDSGIYLDFQSSSPMLESVKEAIAGSLDENWGSPLARYRQGRHLRDLTDRVKGSLLSWLDVTSPEATGVTFCSSGTEAINLAIRGGAESMLAAGNRIVSSRIEHTPVLDSLASLEKSGIDSVWAECDSEGRVDIDHLLSLTDDRTIMVCLQAANQDIGTLQDIQTAGMVLRQRGIPFFVDACFAVGWKDLSGIMEYADAVALSFHRYFGPPCLGVLIHSPSIPLKPLILGGSEESGLRGGLENIHMLTGLDSWLKEMDASEHCWREASARNQSRLHEILNNSLDWLYLNGPEPGEKRSPGNLHYSAAGIEGEGLQLRSDMRGVQIGSGSACLGRHDASAQVMAHLGASRDRRLGSFFVAPGPFLSEHEVEKCVSTLVDAITFLRRLLPEWEEWTKNPAELENRMEFPDR